MSEQREYLWPGGTTFGDLARAVDGVVDALRAERDRIFIPIVAWLAKRLP